jgi:hypothetical protein
VPIQGLTAEELPVEPPWTQLDEGIKPLVRAINATGWMQTRQSCAGHPEREEGPCVWVELRSSSLVELFHWMDRANARISEWLVSCTYIGRQGDKLWFEIRGRYLRLDVSLEIRRVLLETLSGR